MPAFQSQCDFYVSFFTNPLFLFKVAISGLIAYFMKDTLSHFWKDNLVLGCCVMMYNPQSCFEENAPVSELHHSHNTIFLLEL